MTKPDLKHYIAGMSDPKRISWVWQIWWSFNTINTTLIVGGGEILYLATLGLFFGCISFFIIVWVHFHEKSFWQRYFVTDCLKMMKTMIAVLIIFSCKVGPETIRKSVVILESYQLLLKTIITEVISVMSFTIAVHLTGC